jgi:hypothetical protein
MHQFKDKLNNFYVSADFFDSDFKLNSPKNPGIFS